MALEVSARLGQNASAPATVSVGEASTVVVARNTDRRGAVFVNTSLNRISFGIGTAAVMDRGITLYPQGVWEMTEHTFTTEAINAIASAEGSALAVQEFS